jgi:superfamily II DNA/RNA helicase
VLLFSATLDGPVHALVRDYQHNPVRHEVAPDGDEAGEIHHHFWRVERDDRISVTTEAVSTRGPAIIFCRTKHGADRLSDRLTRAGLQSAAIHGDRSQSQRERALAAFRDGHLDALVATDVAARGIHVDAVPLVVQFDLPADPTDYVHRAGRTGRAGADGVVVSLVGNDNVKGAKQIQKHLGIAQSFTSPDVAALAMVEGAGRSAVPAPPSNRQSSPGGGGGGGGGGARRRRPNTSGAPRSEGPRRSDGPRRTDGGSARSGSGRPRGAGRPGGGGNGSSSRGGSGSSGGGYTRGPARQRSR